MAEFLYVFTYDVSDNRVRRRAAKLLTRQTVRVLESVYEGRMSPWRAEKLAGRVIEAIGNHGALRVYAVGDSTHRRCLVAGGPPMDGGADVYLL
jgi:CRISPR-associated protein Cas2